MKKMPFFPGKKAYVLLLFKEVDEEREEKSSKNAHEFPPKKEYPSVRIIPKLCFPQYQRDIQASVILQMSLLHK
jgi:hypothetical protein